MNRAELKQQIVDLCEASGLSVGEKSAACRSALATVQLNVSLGLRARVQKVEPLTRPSGKFMGKQKREAKDD